MHYGVSMFVTDYSMGAAALASALEARGFESVWFPEHSHIPSSRESAWGGGEELPRYYAEVMDPFVILGAAAAVTTELKLGTGVCLVVQRDPIQLAKEVATIDQISGGRFLFGVGGGWNAEEMADHGTAFRTRFALMAERIAAMKTIWTEAEPAFEGEHVRFGPMRAWPKPVQRPHPPIVVGGAYPWGARRAIAYGDEWMPITGRGQDVIALLPEFRRMAAEAGRDPDRIPVTLFLAPRDADALARMRDAGVHRVVFPLASLEEGRVLARLDGLADLARRVG